MTAQTTDREMAREEAAERCEFCGLRIEQRGQECLARDGNVRCRV